jgi:hypothetical protein
MRKIAFIALAGALTLAACGKKEEEAPVTNNAVEPPVENVIVPEPDAPAPPPADNGASLEPAPPPSISEQQQIQDDADATGMTSRLNRDGEASNATE